MADSLDSLILGSKGGPLSPMRDEKAAAEENRRLEEEIARLQSAEPLQSDKTKKGVAAPLNQHAEPNDNHEDEELEALFNEWSTEGLLGNPEPREKPSGASDQKPIKQTALREATKASAALRSNEKENHVASGAVAAVAVNPPLLTTTSGLLSKRLSTGPTQGAPPSSIGDRSFDASS
ncbi:hypothetical protein FOZ63_007527, partial [Perkinsus olseni]